MSSVLNGRMLPYTDVAGIAAVRDTAAEFINRFYRTDQMETPHTFDRSNVILTSGAVQAVYNVLALSIEGSSDVVVSPLPAYGLYKHQTELLGGTFVGIPTTSENNFVPTTAELRSFFDRYITKDPSTGRQVLQIRSVVFCYPNNPAGSDLSGDQARELALFLNEMLDRFPDPGFSVILDEVYVGITARPISEYQSILMYASERLLQSSVVILSASKGMGAMPGMRSAFSVCANPTLVENMVKVQQACSANSNILGQHGLNASLRYILQNPQALDQVATHYFERTSYITNRLNEMGEKFMNGHIVARQAEATFYIFADFSGLPGFETDEEIQRYFRDLYKSGRHKTGVAVVPGSAFAMDPRSKLLRFSCAVTMEQATVAMQVLEDALADMVAFQ
eukprot:GILJ01003269.1.p1 GENE.GILJ01003269.1~~GILJ01003269.1.p1  ORF type:complete len:459 (+),score=70.43 GILJ01003269.1:198-1379(+)